MEFSGPGLLASLVVGSIGFGFFLYGRKQLRVPQLVTGLALMVYPYFVASAAIVYAIAGALLGALWLAVRLGW